MQAWDEGTNIKVALSVAPEIVRAWIVAEVGRLIKDMNCKTTIGTDEELMFCCRAIIDDHPTLRLEEIKIIFDWVRKGKFGKLFERLKTAEILGFIENYCGETRAQILEDRVRAEKDKILERNEEVLEPLGLTDIYDSLKIKEHKPKGQGIGTRLRNKNDWKDE